MSADVREVSSKEEVAGAALLLDRFSREYDDPTHGPKKLVERIVALLATGESRIWLAGPGPDGVVVMRLRPALWDEGVEAYVQELYVAPEARGRGYGRGLMEAAIGAAREGGAASIDLGTEEGDSEARALYESLGFTNRNEKGELMFFYELEF